jgi:hypothetical protein
MLRYSIRFIPIQTGQPCGDLNWVSGSDSEIDSMSFWSLFCSRLFTLPCNRSDVCYRSTTVIGKISRDAKQRTGGVGALVQQGITGDMPSELGGSGGDGSAHSGGFAFPERPVESCFVLPGSAALLDWAEEMVEEWTVRMSQLMSRCAAQMDSFPCYLEGNFQI